MVGKPVYEIYLNPEDREILLQILSEKGEVRDYEIKLITKFGETKYASINARLIFNSEGNPDHIDGALRDITLRKLAEESLQRSEQRLSDIIFSSADWVWEVDENGRYTYSSQKDMELFGISHDEIIGKTPFDFMPDDEAKKIAIIFSEIAANKNPIKDLENWNIGKDGQKICLLTNGVPIFGNDGRLMGYRGVDKNITERKQAEQELIRAKEKAEASDRLKTAFMNNISHEIRTPLNGILGFGEILTSGNLDETDKIPYIKMMNTSIERLVDTVTNFMDISLLKSGNQEVYKTEFEPQLMFHEIIEKYEDACLAKDIKISTQIPSNKSCCKINTDRELLQKILLQLVDNAVKFTSSGEIIIGIEKVNLALQFFVKDTGTGISEQNQDLIFGNFNQENNAITRGYEGSGLGLSIAKGFLELLGSEIRLESEKGEGSKFYFTLDALENDLTSPGQDIIDITPSAIIKRTILIAEDNEINFFYLDLILQNDLTEILHAWNGLEAVEQCKNHPEISMVLMDLKMPEMNGFEATDLIKKFRPNLPVIAVTAYVGSEDREMALKAGCVDFITKPVKKDFLFNKLEEYGFQQYKLQND